MLWNICSVLFLASGACEGLKEYTFRKRLEREGYEIDDNRSTTEKVLGFIRNYAYLLVPVYNIYRAGKNYLKMKMNIMLLDLIVLIKRDYLLREKK